MLNGQTKRWEMEKLFPNKKNKQKKKQAHIQTTDINTVLTTNEGGYFKTNAALHSPSCYCGDIRYLILVLASQPLLWCNEK